MNATDELRRMLDERGVEHTDIGGMTEWANEYRRICRAYTRPEPLTVDVAVLAVPPEQAIAATLGAGTCRVEKTMSGAYEQWSCSECGCNLPIGSYDLTAADAGGAPKVVKRGKFTVNYCPNCGAKVVNDD